MNSHELLWSEFGRNFGGVKHEREQKRATPIEKRTQMVKERRMEEMTT